MKLCDPFNLLNSTERQIAEALLQRYQSHLSISSIAEGISLCLKNAHGLYEDSQLLAGASRWARAMSLLVAAMEEIGKVSVLSAMARIPNSNQQLWADQWASFRSHEDKSTWAFVHTYPDEGRAHPHLLLQAAAAQQGLACICERIRQYGLYVDFHAVEKRWLSPADVGSTDVERWSVRVEASLQRCEELSLLGLYSERALKIQQDVYEEYNRNRPRRRDMTRDDLTTAIEAGPGFARRYFARLIQEGVLPSEIDLTVLGIPIVESDDNDRSPVPNQP